jgi:hypothetical protein
MHITINYNDEDVIVFFDYYEAEPSDNETQGSPSKIVIKEVCNASEEVNEEDIIELILNEIER